MKKSKTTGLHTIIKHTMIICCDFDGTCVEHDYPYVGKDVAFAASILKQLADKGHKIILYTMRSGSSLKDAVSWFKERDIKLWGVNENPDQHSWTESLKVYAQLYIDDAALGIPLISSTQVVRPMVDWLQVFSILRSKYDMDFLELP